MDGQSIASFAPDRLRRAVAWLIPLAGLAAMAIFGSSLAPWQRLVASSLGLLYLLKATILLQLPRQEAHGLSRLGLALYLTLWPGMDPKPFARRGAVDPELLNDAQARFPAGVIRMACGFALMALIALFWPDVGWLGIAATLLTLHFGLADILTFGLRALGFPVGALFDRPWSSRSLRDFWSRRWNRAFVEMDTLLFLPPLRRRFGTFGAILGVFLISGLLHETAISYPAWGGWGGPLLYFALHGGVFLIEARVLKPERRWPLWAGRLWTWLWILAPLPLLFHAPFRGDVIAPLFGSLHGVLCSRSLLWWFSLALWLAGIGHFCILFASFQVPGRLGWREDLPKLTPFNRRLMWTYGATIVLVIVAFGALTLLLHDELLRGGPAARGLCLFIGGFWLFRILVDAFYFRHDEWPAGPAFTVGHAALTGLFVALSGTYLGLFLWRQLW